MRYIYLLLITVIFASCGNQKMHFVRNYTTKQKVVEINDIPSLKTKSETAFVPESQPEIAVLETSSSAVTSVIELDESLDDEMLSFSEDLSSSFPETVQDSTTISSDEAREIANEALYAQKLGSQSMLLAILGFAFLFLAVVALIIALIDVGAIAGIFSLAFAILAFVSWIIGLVSGVRSLRAPFNTSRGRRRAIAGIIICAIPLAQLAISTIFGVLTFI